MEKEIVVELYSGYKDDKYPVRFWISENKLEVLEIEDRWYSPGVIYFKVFADDARHYILKWTVQDNLWFMQDVLEKS